MVGDRFRRAPRTALVLVALACTSALPAGASAQQPQDTTALPAALREARGQWIEAIVRLDASAAAQFFADSVVADVAGEVHSGKRAVVENWFEPALASLSSIRFGTPAFTVSDDEVTERASHAVTPGDGSGEQPGSYVARWRKMTDGAWRVVLLEVY